MNWVTFENSLKNGFKLYKYGNEKEFSNNFANLYNELVLSGLDIHNNYPIKTNINILQIGFFNALIKARRGVNLKKVSKDIMSTIIIYWTSLTMGISIPPPGSVKSIENKVIFPGIPSSFSIYNIMSGDIFIKNLINHLKLHFNSIKGINTSLVPIGTALIPTQFIWTGIK